MNILLQINEKKDSRDKITVKQKKGTWLRFIKIFPKCHLPWLWLICYLILDIGFIQLGVNVTDYTAQLFAGDTSVRLVTTLAICILVNLLGTNLTTFVKGLTSARMNRNMRQVMLEKVMRLPMSYFKDENPRDAMYRIVNNSTVIDNTVMMFAVPLASGIYTMTAIFLKVFNYDWRLSVIMLAFIPVILFMAFIFGRVNFSLSERDSYVNASLTQRLAEMVTNISLAKAFAKEDYEEKRGAELTERLYKINIRSSWFSQGKNLAEISVQLVQSLLITLVGAALLHSESITKRAWVAFFLFSGIFMSAVTDLTMLWNNVKVIQGGADKLCEIMDAPEENTAGELCGRLKGDIKLKNVKFGYVEDKTILSDLNCTFRHNSVNALLGVSGCGKTTISNLLFRLYDIESGSITIDGRSVYDYALHDYRKNFSVVSQNTMLFSGTIRENICYGSGNIPDDRIFEVLKMVNASDFIRDLPDGLDSVLEEYGGNLSGGQRQKLAMTRALLSDAPYLILDEPVASMDAISTKETMDILSGLAKERTIIIIAHTPAVLSIADHVVIIHDGVTESEGTVDEVMLESTFLQEFKRKKVQN